MMRIKKDDYGGGFSGGGVRRSGSVEDERMDQIIRLVQRKVQKDKERKDWEAFVSKSIQNHMNVSDETAPEKPKLKETEPQPAAAIRGTTRRTLSERRSSRSRSRERSPPRRGAAKGRDTGKPMAKTPEPKKEVSPVRPQSLPTRALVTLAKAKVAENCLRDYIRDGQELSDRIQQIRKQIACQLLKLKQYTGSDAREAECLRRSLCEDCPPGAEERRARCVKAAERAKRTARMLYAMKNNAQRMKCELEKQCRGPNRTLSRTRSVEQLIATHEAVLNALKGLCCKLPQAMTGAEGGCKDQRKTVRAMCDGVKNQVSGVMKQLEQCCQLVKIDPCDVDSGFDSHCEQFNRGPSRQTAKSSCSPPRKFAECNVGLLVPRRRSNLCCSPPRKSLVERVTEVNEQLRKDRYLAECRKSLDDEEEKRREKERLRRWMCEKRKKEREARECPVKCTSPVILICQPQEQDDCCPDPCIPVTTCVSDILLNRARSPYMTGSGSCDNLKLIADCEANMMAEKIIKDILDRKASPSVGEKLNQFKRLSKENMKAAASNQRGQMAQRASTNANTISLDKSAWQNILGKINRIETDVERIYKSYKPNNTTSQVEIVTVASPDGSPRQGQSMMSPPLPSRQSVMGQTQSWQKPSAIGQVPSSFNAGIESMHQQRAAAYSVLGQRMSNESKELHWADLPGAGSAPPTAQSFTVGPGVDVRVEYKPVSGMADCASAKPLQLSLSCDQLESIRANRDRFNRYLDQTSEGTKVNSARLAQTVADEILKRCVRNVAGDVDCLAEWLTNKIVDDEFRVLSSDGCRG